VGLQNRLDRGERRRELLQLLGRLGPGHAQRGYPGPSQAAWLPATGEIACAASLTVTAPPSLAIPRNSSRRPKGSCTSPRIATVTVLPFTVVAGGSSCLKDRARSGLRCATDSPAIRSARAGSSGSG